MTPLNVDIATDLMDRLKLAKVLTKTPLRHIAAEAFELWLRQHGITADKLDKLRSK